jgi:zinc D-Ala-D-Ala dipeptidase
MKRQATRERVFGTAVVMAALTVLGGCSQARHEPLVDVADVDSRIIVDIKYATPDNFMGRQLYPVNRCLLRESVARRLVRVQDDLAERGYGLKVYDGYRPLSVQRLMWEVLPDERYVADPAKGSRHNRGAAVDVTLVDDSGRELPMPSAYDEFTERAHRTYDGGSVEARRNRDLLIEAMERQRFKVLETEWWHFDAPGWKRYPVMDVGLEEIEIRDKG